MNLRNILFEKINNIDMKKIPTIAFKNQKIGSVFIRFGHDFIIFSVPKHSSSLRPFFGSFEKNERSEDAPFKPNIIFRGRKKISKAIGIALTKGLFKTTQDIQKDLLLLIKLYMALLAIEYDNIKEKDACDEIHKLLCNIERYKKIFDPNKSELFAYPYPFPAFFNIGFAYLRLSLAYLKLAYSAHISPDDSKIKDCYFNAKNKYDDPIVFTNYWAERMCYSADDIQASMYAIKYFSESLRRIKNDPSIRCAKQIVRLCCEWSTNSNLKKAILLSSILDEYFPEILKIFLKSGFLKQMHEINIVYFLILPKKLNSKNNDSNNLKESVTNKNAIPQNNLVEEKHVSFSLNDQTKTCAKLNRL